MRLVRYNPLNELSTFKTAFDGFFNDPAFNQRESRNWVPAVDILDREDHLELNVELPGINKEDISVNIEERVLTIAGEYKAETEEKNERYYRRERRQGSFKRAFSLSEEILTDEVSADYKDGILSIVLKKNTVKEEVKQITVN
jgi:HSP20 family protein